MDETEQTEVRPASANSENSSENGFVEVTQEDAQMASQSWEDPSSRPVPAVDDEEDLYGAADEGDDGEEEGGGGEGEGEATAELEEEEKVRGHTQFVVGWFTPATQCTPSWEYSCLNNILLIASVYILSSTHHKYI